MDGCKGVCGFDEVPLFSRTDDDPTPASVPDDEAFDEDAKRAWEQERDMQTAARREK